MHLKEIAMPEKNKNITMVSPAKKLEEYLEKGNTAYDEGEYTSAETYYREIVSLDPNHAEAYYKLCLSFFWQRKEHDAFTTCLTLQELAPKMAAELQQIFLAAKHAAAAFKNKNLQTAQEKLKLITQFDPKNIAVLHNLALCCLQLNDLKSFQETTETLLTHKPHTTPYIQALKSLQSHCYSNGLYETAIKISTHIISIQPNNVEEMVYRAKCYWKKKNHIQSLRDCETVLQKDPVNIAACFILSIWIWQPQHPQASVNFHGTLLPICGQDKSKLLFIINACLEECILSWAEIALAKLFEVDPENLQGMKFKILLDAKQNKITKTEIVSSLYAVANRQGLPEADVLEIINFFIDNNYFQEAGDTLKTIALSCAKKSQEALSLFMGLRNIYNQHVFKHTLFKQTNYQDCTIFTDAPQPSFTKR
ncbi:tetratricopeptide repeat protein [Legionella septentrionalis]|nr:tetratricopeptide repeat protein [Legionella septentrionalis]